MSEFYLTTLGYEGDLYNSSSSPNVSYDTELNIDNYKVILPTIWSLIVVIGTVGNVLVLYTLGKNGEITATNCYVLNLAVADLTFLLIVVPFTTAGHAIHDWRFGDEVCKTAVYLSYVTLHATCLTLTAMTIDRYHAIVNPVSSMNWRSKKASTIVSISVWAVSFIISIPFAMYHETIDNPNPGINAPQVYCKAAWPNEDIEKGALVGVIISSYIFPLTVIVISYYKILKNIWNRRGNRQSFKQDDECNGSTPLSSESQLRRRRRVTRMVAVIVLLFATFWFPIHLFTFCWKFIPKLEKSYTLFNIKLVAHTLSYSNSCVNPFVYAFLNDGFKKAFSKTFPCMSSWCLCFRMTSDERYTQVTTGMVDQAIQAMPEEDNDVTTDVINNGGSEYIQMRRVSNSVQPEKV